MQNIIYDEWLPTLLGKKKMKEHYLDLNMDVAYSDEVDPSIVNSFSTAAFR